MIPGRGVIYTEMKEDGHYHFVDYDEAPEKLLKKN